MLRYEEGSIGQTDRGSERKGGSGKGRWGGYWRAEDEKE
jgi:hypothetical protein